MITYKNKLNQVFKVTKIVPTPTQLAKIINESKGIEVAAFHNGKYYLTRESDGHFKDTYHLKFNWLFCETVNFQDNDMFLFNTYKLAGFKSFKDMLFNEKELQIIAINSEFYNYFTFENIKDYRNALKLFKKFLNL